MSDKRNLTCRLGASKMTKLE